MKKQHRNWFVSFALIFFIILVITLSNNTFVDDVYDKNISYQEEQPLEDIFSASSRLHWDHMPITFKFEDNNCSKRQINLTRSAFEKIYQETMHIVNFKEVLENPDISIYCKEYQFDKSGEHTLADALHIEDEINPNLIVKGTINLYGQGQICLTGYPALEVHEILHLFDFDHNPLMRSVMNPFSAESSKNCKITEIDEEYISCLQHIYSNGSMGECLIQNVIIENEEEYEFSCDDGWYVVENSDFCCPEPNMTIDDEGYCAES